MKHTTSIIHLKRDFERRPLIASIRETIPDARLFFGFEPTWEPQRDVRSIKGSSVSHLQCYEQHAQPDTPHLVLEDDATLSKEGWEEFLKMDALPEDCGVLLLGAETPNFYGAGNGLHEVVVPFHGAHAVLYNTPVLSKTHFITLAYQSLAVNNMSNKGVCYEGILDVSLRNLGLRMYRMDTMAFSTAAVMSARVGAVLAPRSVDSIQSLQAALGELAAKKAAGDPSACAKALSAQKPAIPYYE